MEAVQEQTGLAKVEIEPSGFEFTNCARNMALVRMGYKPPKAVSTGTTIVAVTYKDGVVMGADSRATGGNIVANKHCTKVHHLTDSIYACGAGTAADLDQARVVTALRMAKQHLFNHQGYIGAYLIIGGVDPTGPYLYEASAEGTTMAKAFTAMGSGSYAAISKLEKEFKLDMTEEEGVSCVKNALLAGMHGDNGSGNSYNYVVISPKSSVYNGPIVPDFAEKPEGVDLDYRFKPGSTVVLKRKTIKYDIVEEMEVA